MELTHLINSVHAIQVIGDIQRKDVSSIVYDSRLVQKNSVFVAIKGYATDGHKFILDAVNKGAIAVILEDNSTPDDIFIHRGVAKILVANSRKALAQISNAYYKEPSRRINLIGVTGTNGKTTTTFFIKNILETAGNKTGLIGTISNYIGDKETASKLTTPEANDLNALFDKMIEERCSSAVMEVSSHSLILKRVDNLFFKAGLFTNITSDHLDFHGSFNEYFSAKKILFDNLTEDAFAVYNYDDANGAKIVADSSAKKYSYGVNSSADFRISNISYDLNGTKFSVTYENKNYTLSTSLIGEFNAYNAAAAFAVTVLLGVSPETSVNGIKNTKQVPGRFEVIGKGNKKAVIDYSHTADSLEKALDALRKIAKNDYKIYTVFGCGGNRDKTKRPIMGKIASDMSDHVIITSDNPRDEDPYAIIEEIKSGFKNNNYDIIENRHDAIMSAIKNSGENSVILIAGKGHEDYQEIKGKRDHFSDKETAEKYLS